MSSSPVYEEVPSEELADVKDEIIAKADGEHEINTFSTEIAFAAESSADLTGVGGEIEHESAEFSVVQEASMVDGKSISNILITSSMGSIAYTTLWNPTLNAYVNLAEIHSVGFTDGESSTVIPAMDFKVMLDATATSDLDLDLITYENVDEIAAYAIENSGTSSISTAIGSDEERSIYKDSDGNYRAYYETRIEDESGTSVGNIEYYINSDGSATSAIQAESDTGTGYYEIDGTLHEVPSSSSYSIGISTSYNTEITAARSNFDEYSTSEEDIQNADMAITVVFMGLNGAL